MSSRQTRAEAAHCGASRDPLPLANSLFQSHQTEDQNRVSVAQICPCHQIRRLGSFAASGAFIHLGCITSERSAITMKIDQQDGQALVAEGPATPLDNARRARSQAERDTPRL